LRAVSRFLLPVRPCVDHAAVEQQGVQLVVALHPKPRRKEPLALLQEAQQFPPDDAVEGADEMHRGPAAMSSSVTPPIKSLKAPPKSPAPVPAQTALATPPPNEAPLVAGSLTSPDDMGLRTTLVKNAGKRVIQLDMGNHLENIQQALVGTKARCLDQQVLKKSKLCLDEAYLHDALKPWVKTSDIDRMLLASSNFQGSPVSLPMDMAGVAITMVCVMSERRMNRLTNPALSQGLPDFLAHEPGFYSGMMLSQYTADHLIVEQKILSAPARRSTLPNACPVTN